MAPGPEKDVSVFDFLYIDSQRIAVFLAQFGEFGHLTGLTRTVAEGSNRSGAYNVHIAKMDFADTAQTSLQKQYDQRWMAPLTFLDQSKDMIQRSIQRARIGDLVLTSGKLALFDMALLEKAWKLDFVKKAIRSNEETQSIINGHRRSERRRAKAQQISAAQNESEAGLEFMGILPHLIQATISDQDNAVWCILRQDGLTTPANEIFLKHGVAVTGTWNIVGITDALPEEEIDEVLALEQMRAAQTLGGMSALLAGQLVTPIKIVLGRPKAAFGVTPLLIFREIGA